MVPVRHTTNRIRALTIPAHLWITKNHFLMGFQRDFFPDFATSFSIFHKVLFPGQNTWPGEILKSLNLVVFQVVIKLHTLRHIDAKQPHSLFDYLGNCMTERKSHLTQICIFLVKNRTVVVKLVIFLCQFVDIVGYYSRTESSTGFLNNIGEYRDTAYQVVFLFVESNI